MKTLRLILPALLLVFAQQLHAQVKVDMRVDRRLYIVYEPILVTVGITNLSGHDLTLADTDGKQWFSFQVNGNEDRIIPPNDINYQLKPVTIPAGQTVKRSLNLASLYAVQDFGLYHLKASVYVAETGKYYSSAADEFQITEGKPIWQETVGVPEGLPGAGSHRTLSLLTFRMPKENMLYVRVEDKDAGLVYTTSPLGRLVMANDPEYKLDKNNMLHVLQLVGAKTYVYSQIGLNGEWHDQLVYNVVSSKPELKKSADGEVFVQGGKLDVPVTTASGTGGAAAGPDVPKLSDRPAGFPKP